MKNIPLEKVVWVKGTAGLGNRIAALLTAILYSKISRRYLIVDWRDKFYSHTGENVFHHLFTLENVDWLPDSSQIGLESSVYPELWTHNQSLSLEAMRSTDKLIKAGYDSKIDRCQAMFKRYAADVRKPDYPQQALIYSSYTEELDKLRRFFVGDLADLRSKSNPEILRKLYRDHLKLAPPIIQEAQAFMSTHFLSEKVLGVHIRQSDLKVCLAKYQRAVDEFLGKNPNAVIFLATDNAEVEQAFLAAYDRVVVQSKWLPRPGERIHGNAQCPDLCRHAVESLIDLYLLAQCHYLIYSQTTTFGRTAVLMSDLPDSQCFDVDQYPDQARSTFRDTCSRLKTQLRQIRTSVLVDVAQVVDLSRIPSWLNQIVLRLI